MTWTQRPGREFDARGAAVADGTSVGHLGASSDLELWITSVGGRDPIYRTATELLHRTINREALIPCPSSSPRVSPESDPPRIPLSCALTRDSSGFGVDLVEGREVGDKELKEHGEWTSGDLVNIHAIRSLHQ